MRNHDEALLLLSMDFIWLNHVTMLLTTCSASGSTNTWTRMCYVLLI